MAGWRWRCKSKLKHMGKNMNKKDETPTPAKPAATPVVSPAKAMPEPAGGWPADEFSGIGGQYVRDPLTGKRSKVPEATE